MPILSTEGEFLMKKRFCQFFVSTVVKWGSQKLYFHKIWLNEIVYKNFHDLRSSRWETVEFKKMHVEKKVSKIVDFEKISSREFFFYGRIFHCKSSKLLLNRAKRLVDTPTKLQVAIFKGYFSKNRFVEKL